MSLELLDPPAFSSDQLYEVIDGHITEMNEMSVNSAGLAGLLASILNEVVRKQHGLAYTDVLFKLPLPVDRNRRPDVAFVSYSVWPRTRPLPNTNAWNVLPALCVEVVSPTDPAEEVMTKVSEYLTAGVRLVWVVYPILRMVLAFESATTAKVYGFTDEVSAESVVPGFRFRLSDLIPTGEEETATVAN